MFCVKFTIRHTGSSDEETWNDDPFDQTLFRKPKGKQRKQVAKQFYETINPTHRAGNLKIKDS